MKTTEFSSIHCGRAIAGVLLIIALTATAQAQVAFDDSFADGDAAQTGALDTSWWTSSSSSGLEISTGSLGLVTGTSGRGIHTVFTPQALTNIGDTLTATYTFTTPDSIEPDDPNGSSSSFRVGLFNSLDRADLNATVPASSSSPNDLYGNAESGTIGLPGFMLDMDVNTGDAADLNFRMHDINASSGRLLATTGGFNNLSSGPDAGYEFQPNTEYVGSFSITLESATTLALTGTLLGGDDAVRFQLDAVDTPLFPGDTPSFDLLGFHVNSRVFGSTNEQGVPDNGIDFSNIRVELTAVPEPSSVSLLAMSLLGLLGLRKRK